MIKFFSVDSMLKSSQMIGELPQSRAAYSNFYQIAWPSALEALLVGLISVIDTIMVGTLGKEQLLQSVLQINQDSYFLP